MQLNDLSKMFELYKGWQACQPLPKENYQSLWQWIRINFNYLSNNFEGNTLSYSETQLLLIHGRTTGDHELREYEEMKAHDVAFKYICKTAKDKKLITEEGIRDLNKMCLKEPFYKIAQTPEGEPTRKKVIPGKYKMQPNHVLTKTGTFFQFASPEETPALMASLTQWIQSWIKQGETNKHKNLVSFLAELHKRFILIHPFDDGNGRVIRLLMNYILIRLDFLPMVLNHREEYIKAVQFSDAEDISRLEKLFANNIIFMLKKGIYAKNHKIDLSGFPPTRE